MTTTTTPDIAPPATASSVDDWQPGPPHYRVILGLTRAVGPAEVQLAVVQLADGSFDGCCLSDDLTKCRKAEIQTPSVHVRRVNGDEPLTVTGALELAAAIVETTAEIAKWRNGTGSRQPAS
jgi:hypothetical protein